MQLDIAHPSQPADSAGNANEADPRPENAASQGHAQGHGSATAYANIALAKYWGKADRSLNLPAVPSISLTVDALRTETTVHFDGTTERDEVLLDGVFVEDRAAERVCKVLDAIREEAGMDLRARVTSYNAFPTAAGLASSASGFAALVGAARQAAGISVDPAVVSRQARKASASAARSVFGGYVELGAGTPGDDSLAAEPLAAGDHMPAKLLIAVMNRGKKPVASTDGMERTRLTSPFYEPWVAQAPIWAQEIRLGILERDMERVGRFMERSTMAYLASALAADPAIIYWRGATVEALHQLRRVREADGLKVWLTLDAGPHVKALCAPQDARQVTEALQSIPDVVEIIEANPGPGLQWHQPAHAGA